jgi:PAS domain S-box-containing protein
LKEEAHDPKVVWAAALILAFACAAWSQGYPVRSYTADDGLPSPTVRSLAQDGEGVIWFGTEAGLVSFDGLVWKDVHPDIEGRKRGSASLAVDDRGRVWAHLPGQEEPLVVRVGEGWATVAVPELFRGGHAKILSLAATGTGDDERVLMAALEQGVWLRHRGRWLDVLSGSSQDEVRARVRGAVLGPVGVDVATAEHVFECAIDGAGGCETRFAAAAGEEIVAVDRRRGAEDQRLWVLTNERLVVLDAETLRTVCRDLDLEWSWPYPALLRIADSHMAVCGNRVQVMVLNLETGTVLSLGPETGLLNGGATALLLDREGNLWVAGTRGVSKVTALRFANYSREHGLLEAEVSALAEIRPGVLVAGHNIGLSVIDREQGITTHAFPPPGFEERLIGSRRVQEIWSDGRGGAWFAASELGLGRLDPDGTLHWVRTTPPLPRPVTTVSSGRNTGLVVGTEEGLYQVADGRAQRFEGIDELFGRVRRVHARPNGSVWIAGTSLVVLRDGRVDEVYRHEGGDSDGVFCVHEDAFGRIWVGTQDGLLVADSGRLVRPSRKELRLDLPVYSVLEDRRGWLWIGTNDGVRVWDGHTLRHFGTAEGLAGRDTNRGAALVDREGHVWIGTEGGLSRYQAEFDRGERSLPEVIMGHIEAGGHQLPGRTDARLDWSDNTVGFNYWATSFVDERRLRYSYWLEGFDEGWSAPVSAYERSVRYTNLEPGRYRFHVRASARDGEWSRSVTTGWVMIDPPLWNRWWFLLLLGGAVGLVVWFGASTVRRGRQAGRLRNEINSQREVQHEAEERFRLLFDHASLAKVVLEPGSLRVVEMNTAARELFRIDGDAVVGTVLHQVEEMLPEVERRRERARDGAASAVRGVLRIHGVERQAECWIDDIPVGGRVLWLVTIQDVTTRRQREEEFFRLSKLEALGGLAGGIANDFNNVLASTLGQISLAQMRLPPEASEVRSLLEEAQSGLLGARHLTDHLMSFATPGELRTQIVDLGQLLHDTVSLARSGLGLSCALEIPPGFWYVEADSGRLSQVFTDLLLNAHQASKEGGQVTIAARNLRSGEAPMGLEGARFVEVVVEDSGEGIPSEDLERVFEPFYTTRDRNVGLGLATAFAVVQQHGGRIELESRQGLGTIARVVLPAALGSEPRPVGRSAPRTGGGRVLAMDDEPEIRTLYRDVLGVLGYEVEGVPDGEAAVELYSRARAEGRPFDVVILDLTVPDGMGGADTIAALRRLDPAVRAIVASGYTTDPVMSAHENAGFVAAIRKPFTVVQLAQVVGDVLVGATPPRTT